VTPRTTDARLPAPGIPQGVLLACGSFGASLPGARVAEALARGLRAGGREEIDACPLDVPPHAGADPRELLDELDFDRRMRAARAVIVAAAQLEERTLAGSVTFEIATRARQGGVPAYAVTAENRLDSFDARILDLQLILEASSTRGLSGAGRRLARLL
jgi:glycerate kinase